MESPIKNFICISNYFKGNDFLINLKKQGNRVYLITSEKLRDKPWAMEYIDEIFFMPGQDIDWNLEDLLSGVKMIKEQQPQIVFLDIEMPQHSGLELFDFISVESVNFEIIFTTAYSEYAIKAFEFSAIDYLLKPLRPNKVKEALGKASKSLSQRM